MKALLLGPIAPPVSGPGVKNEMMKDWIFENGNSIQLELFNTYDVRRMRIGTIFQNLISFIRSRVIILSVSKKGRFLIIPVCWLFRKKVVLFPAGGSFDDEINNLNPLIRKVYLYCCKNVVEVYSQTEALKKGLLELGFRKVIVFPNPRINRGFKASTKIKDDEFKIIFISMLRKGKGPLLLIQAIEMLIEKFDTINFKLDFYGMIDKEFKVEFLEAVEQSPFVKYKGVAPHDKVQNVISKYHLFVLPTLFDEGVPGAVIEAMLTGIPIVVSEFRASRELIEDEKDGLIVPQNNIAELSKAIERIVSDEGIRKRLSEQVLKSSKKYDYDNAMKLFMGNLKDYK